MSREVISASILLIATVVAVSVMVMVIVPTIRDLSYAYTSVAENLNERVKTNVKIIFVKAVQNGADVDIYFWVKNTGETKIDFDMIARSDIFITSTSVFLHFTASDASVSYTIENGDSDSYWEKSETLRFNITSLSLSSDEYTLTLVLYNGVKASKCFSW